MRALLQSLAALVVLPYALLAAMFLLIGEAARTRGLSELIDVALAHALWIFQWGIYAFAALYLALLLLAFLPRFRRAGALCIAVVAAGSILIIGALHSTVIGPGEFLFLLPCIGAAIIGAWLFIRDGKPNSRGNAA